MPASYAFRTKDFLLKTQQSKLNYENYLTYIRMDGFLTVLRSPWNLWPLQVSTAALKPSLSAHTGHAQIHKLPCSPSPKPQMLPRFYFVGCSCSPHSPCKVWWWLELLNLNQMNFLSPGKSTLETSMTWRFYNILPV
jgi:hypothetical protein